MDNLTKREAEILSLKAEGLTNKQVGKQLFIEACTVITSLKSSRYKLLAKNTTHAVAIALRNGFID